MARKNHFGGDNNYLYLIIGLVVIYFVCIKKSSFGTTVPATLTIINNRPQLKPQSTDLIQMYPPTTGPVPLQYRGTNITLNNPSEIPAYKNTSNTINYPVSGVSYSYPFTFYLMPLRGDKNNFKITVNNTKNIPVKIIHTDNKDYDIFTVNNIVTKIKKSYPGTSPVTFNVS